MTRDEFEQALVDGRSIDLDGCVYGGAHWQGEALEITPPYYELLAGLVRRHRMSRILEIGTHFGGATLSMERALAVKEAEIVTVDVVRHNEAAFEGSCIQRVIADSLEESTIAAVTGAFSDHIDLLFVDAIHDYEQTRENIAVYCNALKPTLLVVDDILLNDDMRRLWAELERMDFGELHDLSTLVERNAGFGVVVCVYPNHLDERGALGRRLIRSYARVRREVSSRISYETKAKLRRVFRPSS